ncbi:DoxX family protein [Flavitalea sp. BT771]|uniref:DoxX family protein n=1 Tax=Flavitalea sp. BT771 TaxID=3063329 RepID=UPI0026E2388A|nr:DoxX family protein [Flavitalea sp. BT771]MDO6431736.1 DoxX family protein [Flavitalea sp. BT771]MDV6220644.1 DoxX family protein [Flavitalea sp. BT771]
MNTILWSCQALLALLFGYSGFCKSIYSERVLVEKKGQTGVAGLPGAFIRFIGISEMLGAVGIILPWLLGVAAVLTPLTAICFAVIMVFAARIHYRLHEPKNVVTNLIALVISIFIAYFRLAELS